jgi:YD repeat-containing protein
LLALWAASVFAQSPVTFQYIYDDLNQLTKVIDSTGVVVQYVYDSVGNIVQINRSGVAPGALTIFNVTPAQALTGATITIQGQGFSTNPSFDAVSIGGVAATVVSATATMLTVTVPPSATSGTITVTVGSSTANSPGIETVVPAPIITSVKPRVMQAGTTAAVTVTGSNLAGSTFAVPGSGITVTAVTTTSVSAVLTLNASATANGRYAIVGNNGASGSISSVTIANAFGVFTDPTLDPDGDGLPNGLELLFGTDAFNADTDGDGFADGVEVASISDPLDPNSTPLNTRLSGDAESVTSGVSNEGFTSSMKGETDSLMFGVLNTGATPNGPIEADSKTFGVLNAGATSQGPIEVDSKTFSVLSNPAGASSPYEADSFPISVCNATPTLASCADYSGLSMLSRLPGGGTPTAGTSAAAGAGATGASSGLPFSVVAVAPRDQAERIAPGSTVTLVFSAPLDPASITANNFGLLARGLALEPEIRYSADFRTVTLRATLPPDASIVVRASDQVRDVAGRQLPAFQSEFQTATGRVAQPVAIRQHPPAGASGVDPGTTTVRLSLANAVTPDRARSGLSVTQDGVPVEGRIQLTQGGQELEFVPYTPFGPGAVVGVSLDGTGDGQLAERHEGLFTTAAGVDGIAEAVGTTPGSVAGAPLNPVLEFGFSLPLDRSSVTPGAVTLTALATSQPVAATVQLRGDRVIRVTPSAFLSPGLSYVVEVSGGVKDLTGRSISPVRQSFTPGSEATSGLPQLVSTNPAGAATDVDADTEIHLLFDRPVNALTLGAETLRLSVEGVVVAASMSLGHGGSEVIVTPLSPLKDSGRVQLAISGVEDLAGNALPPTTIEFQLRKAPQGSQLASNREAGQRRRGSAGRRFFVFSWEGDSNDDAGDFRGIDYDVLGGLGMGATRTIQQRVHGSRWSADVRGQSGYRLFPARGSGATGEQHLQFHDDHDRGGNHGSRIGMGDQRPRVLAGAGRCNHSGNAGSFGSAGPPGE